MQQYNGVEFNEDVQSKPGAVYMFHGGKAYAVPELAGSSIAMPLTSAPLGASSTFTSPVRDRLNLTDGAATPDATKPGILVSKIKGIVFTDQPGTLYIEESNDNATWTQTAMVLVTASQFIDSGWFVLSKRYYRLRYVNGATAQTVFSLFDSTGAGQADVNASLSGSNVTPFTFQNAVGVSGNGQVLNTVGFKTLLVSIFGASSPAGTITFEGAGTDGQFTPYLGSKVGGASITAVTTASSTTNIPSGTPPQPDLWQFDVSALDQFMCPLTWTAGTVTVKGRLMAS